MSPESRPGLAMNVSVFPPLNASLDATASSSADSGLARLLATVASFGSIVLIVCARKALMVVVNKCCKTCRAKKPLCYVEVFIDQPTPASLLGMITLTEEQETVDDMAKKVGALFAPPPPAQLFLYTCLWPPNPPVLLPLSPNKLKPWLWCATGKVETVSTLKC